MFQDHEKQIYSPPGSDRKFDPLSLSRALVRATGGRLNALLVEWAAGADGLGDVSKGAAERDAVTSAAAEEQLVAAAREAFGLPAFPEVLDGTALEWLSDFLGWMEKKGVRGETPH